MATDDGNQNKKLRQDPRVLLLRDEYLDHCRREGLEVPSFEQYADACQMTMEIRDSDAPEVKKTYARTAVEAMDSFEMSMERRLPFEVHPRLSIGYGARVVGYAETIGESLFEEGFEFGQAVYIDEMRIESFNGQATRSERVPDGYFCFLNHGLFRLLHHLTLASSLITEPELEEHVDKPYEVFPELKRIAAIIAKKTMEAYLSRQQHPLIGSGQFQLSANGLGLANIKSFAMKTFVVAHELAHVRLGHLDKLAGFVSAEERWQMEFEADELAQQSLIRAAEAGRARAEILGGGIAFLFCDQIRRNVACDLKGISRASLNRNSTHPPPLQRIKRLDDLLKKYFSAGSGPDRQCLTPVWNIQAMIIEMDHLAGADFQSG